MTRGLSDLDPIPLFQMKQRCTTFLVGALIFSTSVAQLKVVPSGRVGVGNLDPKEALHIGSSITVHDGGAKLLAYNFFYDGLDRRIDEGRANVFCFGKDDLEFRMTGPDAAGSQIFWKRPLKMRLDLVNIFSDDYDPQYKLMVGGSISAQAFWPWSDSRLKQNVEPILKAADIVSRLRGVTWTWKPGLRDIDGDLSRKQYGFIAQEVESILPDLICRSPDSLGLMALNYDGFIAVLAEAIKEQDMRIEQLEGDIEDLRSELTKAVRDGTFDPQPGIMQNRPNPFSGLSEVQYTLPKVYKEARLVVHDLKGVERSNYSLREQHGRIEINGAALGAGAYIYSLIVDGSMLDSKTMVVAGAK